MVICHLTANRLCETCQESCEFFLACCETFPDSCETFLVCYEKFPVCCESFPNCYQTFSDNDYGQDKVK